nr:hypothetical protein [Actinomyces sp.]
MRARYIARRPQLIQSKAWLEGATFTLPEVETLLSGVTTEGGRMEDVNTIRSLAKATDMVAERSATPLSLDDQSLRVWCCCW